MTFTITTIFSPITPASVVDRILDQLGAAGVILSSPAARKERHLNRPFIFIGTGGTEQIARDFLESKDIEGKVTIIAHEGNNSLPASMEIRAYLENCGIPARIVQAQLKDLISLLRDWSFFYEAQQRIAQSRLGIIGSPSFWLIASSVDAELAKATWGLAIEQYPIGMIIDGLTDTLNDGSRDHLSALIRDATCTDISEEELAKAATVTQRLVEFTGEKGLQAVTLECFKLLEDTTISGCYALSHLNDQKALVAGCEGDIASTFTMLLTRVLIGSESFMANVTFVNKDENSVVLAHCTVPTSMTTTHEITTHFETDLSVAIRGQIPAGPVTILKIGGKALDKWWVSKGRLVENLRNESGCRTQVRVILEKPVSYFLESSLANHHILILGDHSERIEQFLQFVLG